MFLPGGEGMTVGPTLDVILGDRRIKAEVIDVTKAEAGVSVTIDLPDREVQRFGSTFAP